MYRFSTYYGIIKPKLLLAWLSQQSMSCYQSVMNHTTGYTLKAYLSHFALLALIFALVLLLVASELGWRGSGNLITAFWSIKLLG